MTTTSLPRVPARQQQSTGTAPLRGNPTQVLQTLLFIGGALLLPLGLVVIVLGWYGAAHTAYEYDQLSYLVSGGILGLGLTFCGGFLYFGAWLARMAADQEASAKRLSDTLLIHADAIAHAGGSVAPAPSGRSAGDVLVLAGNGTTLHRADCSLVDGRDDLRPAGPDAGNLPSCRLCQPTA